MGKKEKSFFNKLGLGTKSTNNKEVPELHPKVTEILNFYETSRNAKIRDAQEWYLNIAQYFSVQAQWDTMTNSITSCDDYEIWINIVCYNINNRISRLIARNPKWETEPEFSVAATDEQISRVTEKSTRYIEKTKNKITLRRKIQLWNHLCGQCFEEKYWDKFGGKSTTLAYMNVKDGEVQPNYKNFNITLLRQGQIERVDKYEGDNVTALWNPFEVFVDTNIHDIVNAKRILLVREVNNDVICDTFGPKVLIEEKSDKLHSIGLSDNNINNFLNIGNSGMATQTTTLVYKYYEKASHKYPEGRLIFIVNNKMVYDGNNPDPDGNLPIIHRFNEDTPNKFWKTAKATGLRPLQVEYCDIRSHMKRTRETSGNLTVFTDDTTDVSVEQIDNYPGLIVRNNEDTLFSDKARTSYQGALQVPISEMDWEMNRVISDVQNHLSIRVVEDRGRLAGASSGVALKTLDIADKEDMNWEIQTIEQQEILSMQYDLMLIKKHYSEDRLKGILGEDTDVFDFKRVSSDYIITQIRIKPYTMLPSDVTAKRNYFLQLAQYSPQHLREISFTTFLKELEFGGLEDHYAREERDSGKALKENRIMTNLIVDEETGQVYPPPYINVDMLIDNHETEAHVHKDYVKSNNYKKKLNEIAMKVSPELAEQINTNMRNHIQMHVQAAMNESQIRMMNEQAGQTNAESAGQSGVSN